MLLYETNTFYSDLSLTSQIHSLYNTIYVKHKIEMC